ncbi:citrate synthase [Homo sapiens]|uniref:Citrate synthase n=1 Tax=Homo sapiens TaxID=9606 RepID=F8VVY4_HUMAN|nr:citrate synthase [Homo sapiens]KAI4066606.1 citrate synthase [Homo sapiens]
MALLTAAARLLGTKNASCLVLAATWQDGGGPNHCGHDVWWHERHEGIGL